MFHSTHLQFISFSFLYLANNLKMMSFCYNTIKCKIQPKYYHQIHEPHTIYQLMSFSEAKNIKNYTPQRCLIFYEQTPKSFLCICLINNFIDKFLIRFSCDYDKDYVYIHTHGNRQRKHIHNKSVSVNFFYILVCVQCALQIFIDEFYIQTNYSTVASDYSLLGIMETNSLQYMPTDEQYYYSFCMQRK